MTKATRQRLLLDLDIEHQREKLIKKQAKYDLNGEFA